MQHPLEKKLEVLRAERERRIQEVAAPYDADIAKAAKELGIWRRRARQAEFKAAFLPALEKLKNATPKIKDEIVANTYNPRQRDIRLLRVKPEKFMAAYQGENYTISLASALDDWAFELITMIAITDQKTGERVYEEIVEEGVYDEFTAIGVSGRDCLTAWPDREKWLAQLEENAKEILAHHERLIKRGWRPDAFKGK